MAELIENPTRENDLSGREKFDASESPVCRRRHRRIAKDRGPRKRRATGYSRKAGASGWTIAKRRNIERAHYESWCLYGCCFAIPRTPGTFFLCVFVESFEFPGLRDAAARWRGLLDWGERCEVFANTQRVIPEKGGWFYYCGFLVVRRKSVKYQFYVETLEKVR